MKTKNVDFFHKYGGIDFAIGMLHKSKIWDFLQNSCINHLGERAKRAEYDYVDPIQTWILNALCGAKRLEHIKSRREVLRNNRRIKKALCPSTVSRTFKLFSVENEYCHLLKNTKGKKVAIPEKEIKNKTVKEYNETNNNHFLNCLLLDSALKLGVLKPGVPYALDIDATIINSHVGDSKYHYKKDYGYSPLVILINGIPLIMESRNGNTSPTFGLLELLEYAYRLLKERNIKVKCVRSDSAGSSEGVISFLTKNNITYYIMSKAQTKRKSLVSITNWQDIMLKHRLIKTASTNLCYKEKIETRMVHYQKWDKAQKVLSHWAIMTNDIDAKEADIIASYHGRSNSENGFSSLKEMGWNYMPHRELKYNTVYMFMTMLSHLIFIYLKRKLREKGINHVDEGMELYSFILKFINLVVIYRNGKLKEIERRDDFKPLSNYL